MRQLIRGLWFGAHTLVSAAAVLHYLLARRGRPLVFRHAADVDEDGLDRQMGPLVDALRARGEAPIEVVLAPLDAGFATELARVRRPFFSHALALGPARAWSVLTRGELRRARVALARTLLRLWRPARLYLIDESGSGQTWLRAARELSLETVGVQHGDFQPWNRQYAARAAAQRGVEPADVLCVWSPWFAERLLAVSEIYTPRNVAVTGRMRYPSPGTSRSSPAILLVADGSAEFAERVAPFLRALEGAGLDYRVAPHPAEPQAWEARVRTDASLGAALDAARLVLGSASSALFEGLAAGRACLVLAPPEMERTYADLKIFPACSDPAALPAACRQLLEGDAAERAARARAEVWGGTPEDPVGAILGLERDAAQPIPSHRPTEV